MKRSIIHMGIALALGLGLILALLWLLTSSAATPVTAAPVLIPTEGSALSEAQRPAKRPLSDNVPIHYVAITGTDSSDCSTPVSACRTIQYAVDQAAAGDEIRVAAGIYTDIHQRAGITQVVYISKTVTIRGGYTTSNWTLSDPDANPTTLDAQGRGRVLYITGDISPTIEGLHITGGDAAGLGPTRQGAEVGGGIYIIGTTAHISGNQVFSNTARDNGGGLYLACSAATMVNTVIAGNRANAGSGVCVGGGAYAGVPRFLHTTIARNTGGEGSGVYVTDCPGDCSTVALTNTILASHTVGITVTAGSTVTLESTLWYGNGQDVGGAGTILTGTVNVYGDPAFVAPETGDYHLGYGSAAIDAGVDAGVASDMDGKPRPDGCGVDIGADEYQGRVCHGLYLPLILNAYQFDRLTYDPSEDFEPALSPDGQTVVFISDRTGQPDVFRIPLTGGQPTHLTQTPSAQEDTPVFSPDGSTIAFASDRTGDWNIYLMETDGANVRPALGGYTGTHELHPAFTPDGLALAFSSNRADGNWDIYTATIGSSAWTRLTTEPPPDRFPSLSPDGGTMVFRSERDGNSEIYLMNADGSNPRRVTDAPAFDGYPSIIPDGSGVIFVSTRSGRWNVYVTNLAGEGLTPLEQREGWQMHTPRLSSDGRLLVYAGGPEDSAFDLYVREFASPLMLIAQGGAANLQGHCYWEAGVLAYGWSQAWRATHRGEYLQWIQDRADSCIPTKTSITHVNDGLLGYAALIAYEERGNPADLAFAQQVADYLMNTATRTADGTLTHADDTVWVDTLVSTVPFLTEMGKVSGESLYCEEAITQVLKHADHLQDPSSGMYHHAWDESQDAIFGPAYWGRGNGWALLADVEVLSAMTTTHPLYSTVLNIMQKHAVALKPLQDPGGLWHTVVTRPDFYLETSASALIGYAFRRGLREGWLDENEYSPAAQAARLGVWRKVLADGTVTDVSAPTGPMLDEEEYNAIPHDALQLYGQGVALLLESPGVP